MFILSNLLKSWRFCVAFRPSRVVQVDLSRLGALESSRVGDNASHRQIETAKSHLISRLDSLSILLPSIRKTINAISLVRAMMNSIEKTPKLSQSITAICASRLYDSGLRWNPAIVIVHILYERQAGLRQRRAVNSQRHIVVVWTFRCRQEAIVPHWFLNVTICFLMRAQDLQRTHARQ